MLELDLLLTPFVKLHYESLCEEDKIAFEVLLEQDDQLDYMEKYTVTRLRW